MIISRAGVVEIGTQPEIKEYSRELEYFMLSIIPSFQQDDDIQSCKLSYCKKITAEKKDIMTDEVEPGARVDAVAKTSAAQMPSISNKVIFYFFSSWPKNDKKGGWKAKGEIYSPRWTI